MHEQDLVFHFFKVLSSETVKIYCFEFTTIPRIKSLCPYKFFKFLWSFNYQKRILYPSN